MVARSTPPVSTAFALVLQDQCDIVSKADQLQPNIVILISDVNVLKMNAGLELLPAIEMAQAATAFERESDSLSSLT